MTDILFYILCVFIAAAGGVALYLAYILCSILIAFTRMCDKEKDTNDTEDIMNNTKAESHADYLLVCRECAKTLNLWSEWSAAKSPYDHAGTKHCDNCNEVKFTTRIKKTAIK